MIRQSCHQVGDLIKALTHMSAHLGSIHLCHLYSFLGQGKDGRVK